MLSDLPPLTTSALGTPEVASLGANSNLIMDTPQTQSLK